VSHTDSSTTALVKLGNGCGSAAPTLTLSPANQSAVAGTALSYELAVVNNDAASCAASTFGLGGTVPSGWSGSIAPAGLTIAAGASGRATLTVASPTSATSAIYEADVSVGDLNVPVHAASATGSYDVLPSTCTRAPTVSASPTSQSAPAGTKLTYSVTVANHDLSGCAGTAFIITPSVPSGWSATVSPAVLTLAAGGSGSVAYAVTSPAGTAPAGYNIQAAISDAVSVAHSVIAAASYTVQSGDSTAPTAPSALVATVKRGQIDLSWQRSTDNLAVTGYRVSRNGVAIASATGTTWTDGPGVPGTYTYTVVAYDAAGNVSASSNSAIVIIRAGKK
jgi:hypothetical protein